jgi:hypothetical protein
MKTNVDHERLARAQAKFAPVARVLDRVAEDIKKEHGSSAVLKQRGPMEPAAQNAYEVRYSLRHPDGVRFALTFIVTGEEADLLLLEAQERSGPENIKVNPAQVDQRVYRLEKIEEIKTAVQEKISAHLRSRAERSTHHAA